MKTDTSHFLSEAGAGRFEPKMGTMLSAIALAVVSNSDARKKGKMTCTFTISKVGDNSQINVESKIATSLPTERGKKTEDDTTVTPYFVGRGGQITIAPPKEDNDGQFALRQVD